MSLQRHLMLALAGYTLLVAALFALFAMAFTYAVEDRFIERGLQLEADRLREGVAREGRWPEPAAGMSLHASASSLPPEVARELAREPARHEFSGDDGRHYHLLALEQPGTGPWLLAEVSEQLVVRPMRGMLLQWLAGWGLAVLLIALGLGAWLARRVARPVAELATQAAQARPEALPAALPGIARGDEIGELARRLSALLARTRDFIEREQAFSRDASHELRTPLAVLRLGLERLPDRQAAAPMLAAVQLMEQTVATLLQLARESEARPVAPTPLLPWVETWVLAHAEALDARGLQLDCRLERGHVLALPPAVLQLALGSLLGNALRHAEAGGRIELDWAEGGLRICNPGLGGPPGEGLGLGLVLVQRLLERHKGRLRFEQREGCTEARIETGAQAFSIT